MAFCLPVLISLSFLVSTSTIGTEEGRRLRKEIAEGEAGNITAFHFGHFHLGHLDVRCDFFFELVKWDKWPNRENFPTFGHFE